MKLKENRFEYKTYGSDIERNLTNILILLNTQAFYRKVLP